MRIYIAGPITGDPNYKAKFDAAEEEIRKRGHKPFNPTWQPLGLGYREYIDNSLNMLRQVDAAVFLPGWELSTGSCLERKYCKTVNVATCDRNFSSQKDAVKEQLDYFEDFLKYEPF